MLSGVTITQQEFDDLRRFIYTEASIDLSERKRMLVVSRLAKRLRHFHLASYGAYVELLNSPAGRDERQIAIDLLTTNETYFFREAEHFDYIRETIIPKWSGGRQFRVWSAAASSGEEAYTLAMVLDDALGNRPFEIVGTDINGEVLAAARTGLYREDRGKKIPRHFLKRYCRKGIGEHAGTMLVDKRLRNKTTFIQANLLEHDPKLGLFDVILLRNVMIYFDDPTKKRLIARLADHLRPGGYLITGHADTVRELHGSLTQIHPSVYCRLPDETVG